MSTKRVNIEVRSALWKQVKIRCAMKGIRLIDAIDRALVLFLKDKEVKD